MRAKEFIKEDNSLILTEYKHAVSSLERSCGPYLKAIGGIENALFNKPLYRGMNPDITPNLNPKLKVQSMIVRRDRKPKDTPAVTQNLLDDWFEHETGIRFRSSAAFCTGDKQATSAYGTPYVIIPIGDFSYCWSQQYADMYDSFYGWINRNVDGASNAGLKAGLKASEFIQKYLNNPETINSFMTDGEYKFNWGLEYAIASGHEIMLYTPLIAVIDEQWLKMVNSVLSASGNADQQIANDELLNKLVSPASPPAQIPKQNYDFADVPF